jgi:branched-chain amino acid transport system permease protein
MGTQMGTQRNSVLVVVAILALLTIPPLLPVATIGILGKALIAALFASAFSLLIGQGGMLSFGHSAYFAVGCFATIHAMSANILPTPLLPLAGAFAGFAMGVFAGFFATMRSGVYFSMVTLAIAEVFHSLAPNLQGIFGGEAGVSSMRRPWAGVSFGSDLEVYYLILFWTAVGMLLLFLYTRTLFGRLTFAVKENERRVAFLGYNVHHTKLLVFAISSLFAGLAGGLLAVSSESANYVLFQLNYSADVVLNSFIGGVGTFLGPAFGAAAMTLFGHAISEMTRQWVLYLGLIFVLVMMYAPHGLGGIVITQTQQIRQGGPRVLANRLMALAAMVLTGTGTVLLCEVANTVLSRDYQAELVRTAKWAVVRLFGVNWSPDNAVTWIAPCLAISLGPFSLHRLSRPRAEAPQPHSIASVPGVMG